VARVAPVIRDLVTSAVALFLHIAVSCERALTPPEMTLALFAASVSFRLLLLFDIVLLTSLLCDPFIDFYDRLQCDHATKQTHSCLRRSTTFCFAFNASQPILLRQHQPLLQTTLPCELYPSRHINNKSFSLDFCTTSGLAIASQASNIEKKIEK
jgi:hypothetical protein